jgi:septin family protein
LYRKVAQKEFNFNLLVVGEQSLGKSRLINTLFLTQVYDVENPSSTVRIKDKIEGLAENHK